MKGFSDNCPREKLPPKPNLNPSLNPNPDLEAIFLREDCPEPLGKLEVFYLAPFKCLYTQVT